MTMYELCAECRNWFERQIIRGTYTVTGGVLQPIPGIPEGAYIRVVGSVFNDGVFQYPHAASADETFDGAVWLMAIPEDFVQLCIDITAWEASAADAVAKATEDAVGGPFTSESFGDYSYTRKNGLPDIPTTWKDPRLGFAARLNRWRKI
jgi:hypothetical protein